ncbi:MAG: hypothetical protein GF332_04460 [Candidatus Moranbacteria bacterium]|nr:hypothetical protein [Candidatus Moranbacteria bacterium]
MNPLQEKNQNIMTLGELLKNEREKLGISIERAANILMVRQRHLVSLENDLYDNFPAGVYFRGFLRSYARLLGLDEQKVFEYYECQLEIFNQNQEKDEPNKGKSTTKGSDTDAGKKIKLVITPEWILRGIGLVVVLIIIGYFVLTLRGVARLPELTIAEPVNNKVVKQDKVTIRGTTTRESELFINGEEISIDENGYFETQISLMQGLNEINFKVNNKFDKETEKTIFVNYQPEQKQDQEKAKRITLQTDTQPVWVSVKSDSLDFNETLPANTEKVIEIKSPTTVIVDKGNAIYFTEESTDPKQAYLNPPNLELFSDEQGESQRTFKP